MSKSVQFSFQAEEKSSISKVRMSNMTIHGLDNITLS